MNLIHFEASILSLFKDVQTTGSGQNTDNKH